MSINFYQLKKLNMKKTISILLSGIVLLSTLAWCTNTSTQTKTDTKTTVKVWVIAPLSWPAAVYWEDAVNAYKFTLEKMKQQGKMEDYNIELIYEDGKCNGKDSTSAAQKLISVDKVDMILGWVCSAETLAAAKVAQAYKIPMLSAASSAPAISKLWEWIWRFYSDINQAHLIADYLNDKWSKNIAVLYENTDYAVDFFQTLKPLYKWNILIDEKINSDERDLWIVAKKVAKQVESLDAVIFVNGWTDSLFLWIINKLDQEWVIKNLKWEFIWTDTLFSSSILDVVSSKMEWFLWATLPDDWSTYWPKVDSMMGEFKQQYWVKGVNFYIILYEEAINLITDMFDAGNRDAQSISAYLKLVDKENQREWFFGRYYFQWTDSQWLSFVFKKIVNGKPEFIK